MRYEVFASDQNKGTLKKEAAGSSESIIPIYKITWRNIPEVCNLRLGDDNHAELDHRMTIHTLQ